MLLLLLSAAQAQECTAPLSPDAFSARLDQVKEGVLFGEPAAADELARLEAQLPCLDGPVDRVDLARLMQSQAAYALFLGQDPKDHLQRAAILGEPPDPDYGPQFAQALAAAAPTETAYLDLDFQPAPAVLFVDGQIHYDTGPQQVAAGWHIVQWMGDDGAWTTRVLQLGPGGRERIQVHAVGSTPPPPPPQTNTSTPASPSEVTLVLNAGLAYQIGHASYTTPTTVWSGLIGAPALSVGLHSTGTWHLRADANLIPWATGSHSGGSNRVAVGGGWQQTQGKRLHLAPAVLVAGASRPTSDGDSSAPTFEPDLAFGGSLLLGLQASEALALSLALEGLQTGVGARLGTRVSLPGVSAVPLWVGASANTFRGNQGDSLSWAQVGVGGSLGI